MVGLVVGCSKRGVAVPNGAEISPAYGKTDGFVCAFLMLWEIFRIHSLIHRGPWMSGLLIRGYVARMLECEPDVIQPFEQDMLPKRSDFKIKVQTGCVGDGLIRQIGSNGITLLRFRAPEDFVNLSLGKCDRENPVFEAVIVENIRVARSDQDTESVVGDGPGSML